jgi:thioredoxin-related protein
MKTLLSILSTIVITTSAALAEGPAWGTDVSKAILQATKENKLGFILMGREACGNCQATKRMVNEGRVPVTADAFVTADINVDDAKARAEFERKFKKEKFGSTLPSVVITDSRGKALASYSGMKDAAALTALIDEAKKKAATVKK